MTGALDGIRVLDWTIWQQGPAASAMLGDLGAEVIKIEERGIGDPGRAMYSIAGLDVSSVDNAYFEVNNRNKKSVAIDLKTPKGIELVHRLVGVSDIFVHNFRPGVPERLKLDYATLSAVNPRLIYGAASAYDAQGEEKSARAYDLLGLARSGIMSAASTPGTGEPGHPKGAIADQAGAIALAYGILAAVIARERHGMGQRVEASLLGGMMWLQNVSIALQLLVKKSDPSGNRREPINPLWNYYRCGDGKWIAFAMPQSVRFWPEFVELIDRPDLATDPRFVDQEHRGQNSRVCVEILDEVFAAHPRDFWIARMATGSDIPCTPVNTVAEVVEDAQALANNYIVEYDHPVRGKRQTTGFPVAMSETPLTIRDRAPEFGEHTEDVLMTLLDLDWDDITRLQDEHVI